MSNPSFAEDLAKIYEHTVGTGCEGAVWLNKSSQGIEYSDLYLPTSARENYGADPRSELRIHAADTIAAFLHSHPGMTDITSGTPTDIHQYPSLEDLEMFAKCDAVGQDPGFIGGVVSRDPCKLGAGRLLLLRTDPTTFRPDVLEGCSYEKYHRILRREAVVPFLKECGFATAEFGLSPGDTQFNWEPLLYPSDIHLTVEEAVAKLYPNE
ncbi:MAG TPA: hypothetical protein VJP80_04650 [Candidatus Saccharimonadales bacterium]|nr:hypothetical protein [Candidatus Saccharimonadales bacterium]